MILTVEVGPPGGAPLVVVHGGPGETHHCLRPHLDRLAASAPARRVVYYDQRRGGLGWREHVADLEAVRVQLGVEAVAVCAFSWGCLLALLHALEHPGRTARLLLISPPAVHASAGRTVAPTNTPALAELRARLAPLLRRAEEERPVDPATVRRARFALKVAPFFFDPALALQLEPVDTDEAAAAAATRSLDDLDLRPRLPSLAGVPSLVVRGAADPVPAEHAATVARLLGAPLVVIERAGHAPFVEAPGPFLAAAQPFLDAL